MEATSGYRFGLVVPVDSSQGFLFRLPASPWEGGGPIQKPGSDACMYREGLQHYYCWS